MFYLADGNIKEMWRHNVVEILGMVVNRSSCHKPLVIMFDFFKSPFFYGSTGFCWSDQVLTLDEAPQAIVPAYVG